MKIGSTNNPLQFAVNYFTRGWDTLGNCENGKIETAKSLSVMLLNLARY